MLREKAWFADQAFFVRLNQDNSMQITTYCSRKLASIFVIASLTLAGCMRVEITDPANGSFTEESTVTVSGNVFSIAPENAPLDINDLTLEINGSPVVIAPDGSYSTNVLLDPYAIFNPIEAELVEVSEGHFDSDRVVVIAGDSIAEGDYSPEAIALQINASGLASLQPVVSELVDLDLPSLMPVGTTVVNKCMVDGGSVLGCLGRARVKIANPAPNISSFDVSFNAQQDSVHADVALNDFALNVFIDGNGLVPDCGLKLTADSVALSGDYALEPDSENPTRVDVYQLGDVSSNFISFNESYTSGVCDDPIIGDVIQLIIGDVEPLVVGGLESFLNAEDASNNTPIAAAVEGALAGVDISGPIGQALTAQLDAPFFQVVETTGGITLGSDARFISNVGTDPGQCNPPDGAPDLDASYHVTQPFPSFGNTTPEGTPYEIGMGISTSGFNQLLRSMIECGLLIATIDSFDLYGTGTPVPLTAGLLSVFIPQLASLDPASPARFEIKPTIAPLITGATGPAGELALLKVAQLHLQILIDVETESGTQEADYANLMIDADVGIDLTLDAETGALVFELAEPDPANIAVKSIEGGGDLSNLEALLPAIVGTFLPDLASGLGGFPIPSFLGLSLDVVEVGRNGEMLTIYADLVADDSPGDDPGTDEPTAVYYRTYSGNLESYASLEDMGNRNNVLNSITWEGSNADSATYDGNLFYRTRGSDLNAYATVEDLAARTNLVSSTAWNGATEDSLGFDGVYYFRSSGSTVNFYATAADAGARTNEISNISRVGSESDAFDCDLSVCFRAYSGSLEVYGSAQDMAARTAIISSSNWTGSESDSMFAVPLVTSP